MPVKMLTGDLLFDTFASGGYRVIDNRSHLNRINVFPVPDGDTGSNLAFTFSSILENGEVYTSASRTMRSIAEQALIGARGNSGIILAQFFSGLSEGFGDAKTVTPGVFGAAVGHAVERAYQALSHPVEGTMLTVIRDWAREVAEMCHRASDFAHLFRRTIHAALESLKRTPETLWVLREARVVDAGGEGFVHFLQGAFDFFRSGMLDRSRRAKASVTSAPHEEFVLDGRIPYRYCTEALIRGAAIDHRRLSGDLEGFGDSLIVAGSADLVRVHIHTDSPAAVMDRLRPLGDLVQQKADDMVRQQEVVYNRRYPIALVTDSVCDLPQELIDRYQIHRVPLTLSFGENQYLDRLTITADRFYTLLDRAPDHPRTSQPSAELFRRLYSFLSSHYRSIIAIHLSSRLSGTWNVSRLEAERVQERRISVIDSRHLSGSLGLLVLRAAEEIAAGRSHEEVVETVEASRDKARILVSVQNLKYMVKGGRVSPLAGVMGRLLNLKPIVSLDREGNSTLYGKAFSRSANRRRILGMVADIHRRSPLRCYAVVHAHAPERAGRFADGLERITGKPPLYQMDISPVVGVSAGLGAVAVVTLQE